MNDKKKVDRRDFLKGSVAASTGFGAAASFEENHLLAQLSQESKPHATSRGRKELPYGQIKNLKISRLFCGGNLIGGWAHSRDLIYVSDFVKAYHTDEKVFDTLEIAEENGINTVLTNPRSDKVINKYWDERGGKIQWISDCAVDEGLKAGIQRSIDSGAHAVYVQGGIADRLVREEQVDELAEALEFIREQNTPGGLGAHCLETVQACVDAGIKPDFWVKTLHSDQYWSATPVAERPVGKLPPHDNMWCMDPKATIDYMKSLDIPWIAFKVMAAGAIHPSEAFQFAFENGADFVCAGMFDFQVVEDALIARRALASVKKRKRPWRA